MIGRKILHYRIIEKLGQGGMGVVYLAEDSKLERQVAIKFLPAHIATNADDRKRFEIEAKAAAALNHPNISTIYAIEEFDSELFLVMEYIEGQELTALVPPRESHIDREALKEFVGITTQIASGLQAAHAKGIIHRDIKTSNIMITKDGKVKIMDFGLAIIGSGMQLTKEHSTLGTAPYMSPEQILGEEVDQRTDIWAMGVVMYQMLTGKAPFEGVYEQAVIYSILNEDPDPISNYTENCSAAMLRVVDKCLEKDRANRYQNVDDVLRDLKSCQENHASEIIANLRGAQASFPKTLKEKKMWISAGTAFVILLLFISLNWVPIKTFVGLNSSTKTQHLLILPFTNIGGNQKQQAFCDGLIETLSSQLTQIEPFDSSLWVVPTSEVIRNSINSPDEAYKKFGANLVLTGSIQFLDKKFRLTLNLVNAKTLRQLSSALVDVKADDISSLQDEAVIQLLKMLHIQLEPELKDILQAGGTSVPQAYENYIQGRGYLQRYEEIENIDEAINLFKLSINLDSLYTLAYAGLGEAYWYKYKISKNSSLVQLAVERCEQAFKLDSLIAPVKISLGTIYLGTGRYDAAVAQFKHALLNEPSNAAAFRGLAKAYEALKKNTAAETTYKRAIKVKPGYWAGYNVLGVFYFKNGQYEDAIEQFKMVIKLTPDNYRGYNNLGGIYYMLERWKDAREMFERSLKIKKSYNIYSNLGTLYYIEGKYEKAAQTYELAVALNDKDYLTWGNLAAAYNSIPNKKDKAIGTYQRAIEMAVAQLNINPNDPDVLSNLGSYYADIGNENKSLSLLQKALKLAPDNVQIMYRAATIYEALGNRDAALRWIELAIQNGYSHSEIEHQPELTELVADKRYKKLIENFKKN